jgi:lipopolysaccharide/colanic/teichoic acid biosynthesis glycosyltransferase
VSGDAASRALDLAVAGTAAVLSAPVQLALAVAVKLDTPGPVLHRGRRVGRDGREFDILKFRTMVVGAASMGPGVTGGRDPRVTRVGRVLRRTKLDELPQLWNVLRGDMGLVGHRPEDPRYVARYTSEQRRILARRPGLTGAASVEYRDEESVLAGADDVEAAYLEVVMPAKLEIDLRYLDERSLLGDLRLLVRTARAVLAPRAPAAAASIAPAPATPGDDGRKASEPAATRSPAAAGTDIVGEPPQAPGDVAGPRPPSRGAPPAAPADIGALSRRG